MKAAIQTLSLWLTGEIDQMTSDYVQIICTNVKPDAMSDLYNLRTRVMRLLSDKLLIEIRREDILSIEFIDNED